MEKTYGMEHINQYIDDKIKIALKDIRADLASRELNIIAAQYKEIQNLDEGVKELVFKHMPTIINFLNILKDLKLNEAKYLSTKMRD